MASAKGRVLTDVRGTIENGAEHYGFQRNGKQFIGCVHKGWNRELIKDEQKINAVIFRNSNIVATEFARCIKEIQAGATDPAYVGGAYQELSDKVDWQAIIEGFKAQPIDPTTGYPKDYPTMRGYIMAVVCKSIREEDPSVIQTAIEAVNKTFYAENIEGYNLLKAAGGAGNDFVVD